MAPTLTDRRIRASALVLVFSVALTASWLNGTPSDLPAAALEWAPLFHVLRVSAVLAILGAAAVVGWRATGGHFPIRFGQIEYDASAVDDKVVKGMRRLEQRICCVEDSLDLTMDDIEAPR